MNCNLSLLINLRRVLKVSSCIVSLELMLQLICHVDEVFDLCRVALQEWVHNLRGQGVPIHDIFGLDNDVSTSLRRQVADSLHLVLCAHDQEYDAAERESVNVRSQLIALPVCDDVLRENVLSRAAFPEKQKVAQNFPNKAL